MTDVVINSITVDGMTIGNVADFWDAGVAGDWFI